MERLTRKGRETYRRIVSEAAALMYEHGVAARGQLSDHPDPDRFALTQARRYTVALEAFIGTLIDCLRGHVDH